MEKTYKVKGMSCVICKNNVETSLNKLEGVNSAIVNLLEDEVLVNFDDNRINELELVKAVKKAGYELVISKETIINKTKIILVISILLTIILMYISMMIIDLNYLQLFLSSVIILLNINIYISGFKSLFKLHPNMNSLVSLSSFISFIYSLLVLFNVVNGKHLYFETSAMVLVIVSIGKTIEGSTKNKTVKVIRGLSTLIPMETHLIKDDNEIAIPINDLKKNDIVLVKAGESIPRDGIIIKGSSSVNESMITGEVLPRNVSVNDEVIGGTINNNGTLYIRISKTTSLTVLSNIINLTKKASSTKIPIERFADKISRYFVFVVIIISLITMLIWLLITKDIETALNYGLSVLVISCPCALGLATPAAVGVAIGKAAKEGILIKKPEVLEHALKMRNVIFDKTGTLTTNTLEISNIEILDNDFINVLCSMEKTSNHPIGKAIINKYGIGSINFDSIEYIGGEGLKAKLNNDIYLAGNDKLIKDLQVTKSNVSCIAVSKNDKLLGIVYVNDIIRDNAKASINNLKKRNIIPIMCTGDNKVAASNVSKILGIDEYLSEIKPEDKNILIEEKKKEGVVVMVGDGINDSIALANSDISISIKSASDIAFASSDVILMKNDLNDISYLYDLSMKTMIIIKQNLFWALGYNVLCIPIAAGVYSSIGLSLNPMIGSSAMLISSIFVLLNALRINNVKKEKNS